VIGEIIAGILLDPSILGRLVPGVSAYVLPVGSRPSDHRQPLVWTAVVWLKTGAKTKGKDNVRIAVAMLAEAETRQYFGRPLEPGACDIWRRRPSNVAVLSPLSRSCRPSLRYAGAASANFEADGDP
jgi:hypothetical protein